MKLTFSGSVHFANGDPAPNVTIRIFDKDAPGKEDDDLTVTPGVSGDDGTFSLTYEPLRYLDFHANNNPGTSPHPGDAQSESAGVNITDLADIYLPYLKFNYTFKGLTFTHIASMGIFKSRFYLPENPPVEFLPSIHGFRFANNFRGYFLPFSTPAFMGSPKVTPSYGLCGGMCAAAYDFALLRRPVPTTSDPPRQGSRFHRYLFQRQMDSLGGLGQQAVKVAQWTSLPDDTLVGTLRRTADELVGIRLKLDQENLVVLALIYVHAASMRELSKVIFNNHQVLAYSYLQEDSGALTINVYDPNLPIRDDVSIHIVPVPLGEEQTAAGPQVIMGGKAVQLVGGSPYRDVRGIFAMPFNAVQPPQGI